MVYDMLLLLVAAVFTSRTAFALQNPYCSLTCDFGGGRSYFHTVCEREKFKCGPGPKCGPDFKEVEMTDALRQYILDLHNELRNNVAAGNETRGGRQPQAKKMMTMKYSKELEYIAQCWANNCQGNPLIHDVCRATKQHEHIGQNLGFLNSTHAYKNIKDAMRQLVMNWYDEVALFRREWVHDTQDRGPNVKVGHYTQMIWADTDTLGCAVASYTSPNPRSAIKQEPTKQFHPVYGEIIILPAKINKKWHHLLLVCNYSPGGNYLGAPLYDQGQPCSGCPKDKPCSRYSSMCGDRSDVRTTYDNFTPFFRF